MSMNEESLRRLIREEIEHALDEADAAAKKPPQTFEEFRNVIGDAVKQAGGPEDLVDEILDVDYEGGGVAGVLGSAWHNLEYEYRDIKRLPHGEQEAEMWDVFMYSVHDAVIDMADAYRNAWNYEPGRKAGGRFDAVDLAQRVQKIVSGAKLKRSDTGALKKMKGDITADDILKPLATAMKAEFKATKTALRMGGVKGNSSNNPALDVSDSEIQDTTAMMAYASEQVVKILTDLGCEKVQEHDVGGEEAGVTAKSNDFDSGIKKNIYVDFENLGPGKMRVWCGIEET
jgi:hypothetical protein